MLFRAAMVLQGDVARRGAGAARGAVMFVCGDAPQDEEDEGEDTG